jgi:NADH:ubiquinone oxidoreductase subunit 6 (subunit J)
MLLNVRSEEPDASRGGPLGLTALGLCALLLAQLASVLLRAPLVAVESYDASTARVAQELFSPRFLYAFEATSVLILAALVGAIALAKKEL